MWLYPFKRKSDVSTIFPQFKRLVEKYFGYSIVSVFSDNGGEFIKLLPLFNYCGISHFTTPPHTPERNGTAKHRHMHVVETGMSLLNRASLPVSYWSYAFETTAFLINRLPTPVLGNISPFQKLFNCPPNYKKLKSFGCLCYPWLRPYISSKLQPRSKSCVFLGYSISQAAYRCLDPVTGRVYI